MLSVSTSSGLMVSVFSYSTSSFSLLRSTSFTSCLLVAISFSVTLPLPSSSMLKMKSRLACFTMPISR